MMRTLPQTLSQYLPETRPYWHGVFDAMPWGNPLLFIPAGTTDTITLSVDDYDSITTDQQAFFFTDPSTPNTWAGFAAFLAAVSAQSWLNDGNVIGTAEKGVAIYAEDTSIVTLNRGYRWFGLSELTAYWEDVDGNQIQDVSGNPVEVMT